MIQVYDKYGKIKTSGTPGAGTITNFSAGNFSPLFTTAVTSPTSTPNLAFTGISQAQNLFYASPNGSSGIPSFRTLVAADIPSLSTIYVPVGRTLTINGVTYDLSTDRSWTITASGATWGSITGTLSSQTDLITYLSANYYPLLTNPSGYLTSSSLSGYATETWTGLNFYPLSSNPANYVTEVSGFNYFDAKPIVYQKHISVPVWGQSSHNNVEGVTFSIQGPVARSWADTNVVTRTQRLGMNGATTGTVGAQFRQTQQYFSRNGGFSVTSGFNMAENANDTAIRFFMGIRSSIGTYSNVEPDTLINLIGVCRLSTSNNLHLIHNDATGTATTIDLGSDFPANTVSTDKYIFVLETVPTGVYFRLERVGTAFVYETIITSDLPAADLGLVFGGYMVDTAGANTTTGFDWYGTYVRV
jgi:hypothetical protein